ncbi:MAG: ParB family chromosome partitioning protein [Candidatus Saccharimonadales bacterium]
MAKSALGRGFDSLIPVDFAVEDVVSPGEQVKNLSLSKIIRNPDQPRKEFDPSALQELAESIKRHGVIQPIVVLPVGDQYRIVAGERRCRASQIAKLKTIPALIRNHKELEELEISLVENVQRVDLSPLEQAVSISKLRDQFSLSLKEIAAKLGKAETTVSNSVRLLKLPEEAVEALQKNAISEGHARAILALSTDTDAQKELLNKIVVQRWSVREAESFVQQKKNKKASVSTLKKNTPEVAKMISNLNTNAASRVSVREKKNGGVVSVSYRTIEELKSVLSSL